MTAAQRTDAADPAGKEVQAGSGEKPGCCDGVNKANLITFADDKEKAKDEKKDSNSKDKPNKRRVSQHRIERRISKWTINRARLRTRKFKWVRRSLAN